MKAKWMTSLMIAAFSAALALGTGASAGEMDSGMKSHEGSAAAGGSGSATKSSFYELDQNGDGRISEKEAASDPSLADHFQRLDSDGDGHLEKGEFAQFETMKPDTDTKVKEHKGMEHW